MEDANVEGHTLQILATISSTARLAQSFRPMSPSFVTVKVSHCCLCERIEVGRACEVCQHLKMHRIGCRQVDIICREPQHYKLPGPFATPEQSQRCWVVLESEMVSAVPDTCQWVWAEGLTYVCQQVTNEADGSRDAHNTVSEKHELPFMVD